MYLPSSKLPEWRRANTPDLCPILHREVDRPVVDHDHKSGEVRGVISSEANVLIGKIENSFTRTCAGKAEDLPDTLRRIADYLERDRSGILHPKGAVQLTSRFKNKLTAQEQIKKLSDMGASDEDIQATTNAATRAALYNKVLKNGYNK